MKISIVLPAFNEEGNIVQIYKSLHEVLEEYRDNLEIIFVDDGSFDGTFGEVKKLSEQDQMVRGVRFSRNFGQQSALLAGLNEAKGDIMIMMDADGQHPPEVIPQLIEEYRKGYDIVNTRRKSTADSDWFKRFSSRNFYRMLNLLSDVRIEPNSSDFRLMSRKAVEAFLHIDEQNRFTRGLVSWIGFSQSVISYEAPERFSGKSKYTLRKMVRFGVDGITSFSSKPLRISFIMGMIAIIFALVYGIYAIVMFYAGRTLPGWTSLMITILLLGGFQLLSIGIIGEYLGRIFHETKRRPHYFIQDRC